MVLLILCEPGGVQVIKRTTKMNRSLFFKYFLSYLLIFLIPFTIISFSFYYISIKNLRGEIINSNIAKLEQVRDFTDDRLSELRQLSVQISLNNRLTPYKLSQPYTLKEGISELKTYEASNSIIDTLILTYFGDPTLYTTRGTTAVENLMQNMFAISEEEYSFFTEELEQITKPTLRTIKLSRGDQDKKALVYVCPIPPQSYYSVGAVVFFLKGDKLSQLTANLLGDFEGSTYIYDNSYNVIATSSGSGASFQEFAPNLPPDYSGVITGEFQGEDYSFVLVQSQDNPLSFASTMPTAQFYQRMATLRSIIIILLVVTAIIGTFVAIRLSLRQYRPVHSLTELVGTHWERIGRGSVKTAADLDEIRETIEVIFEDTEKLREKVVAQQSYVRDQFLLRLLRGQLSSKEDPEEVLAGLGMNFPGNYFFVIMVAFNERVSEKSLEVREETLSMLQQVEYKDTIAYGVELFSDNGVALIVSQMEMSDALRRDFARSLANGLVNLSEVTPTIGVGKLCNSLTLVNRSFVEATVAVEHYLRGHDYLIFFEELTEAGDIPDWYSFEHQVQLTQGIKQGNQKVALEALENIIQDLKDSKPAIQWLKYMCFDLINTVLKVNSELGFLANVSDTNDLTEFNTLEELAQKLGSLIVEICEQVEQKDEADTAQLHDAIIRYIEKEFTGHDLSLTKIADVFGLSASYLSKLIKELTGVTFTQYVWDLRVTTFKEKLISTDEPIKNLVCEIGYVDVANFTRRFRESEGMTPGQYRQMHRKAE